MKKLDLRGCGKVFRFVLARHMSQKSYIILTSVVAVLLFGIVFALTLLPNLPDNDTAVDPAIKAPTAVTVCDETADDAGIGWLTGAEGIYGEVVYTTASCAADVAPAPDRLVLSITASEDGYELIVISSEDTVMTPDDISAFSAFASESFRAELYRRAGIDPSAPQLSYGVTSNLDFYLPAQSGDGDDTEIPDDLRGLVEMIVSILVIFVMYFMVLLYGQTAAGSVILEKTSKLMDFFLVSVNTSALMLGKVLAIALAAIIQVSVWLLSAGGGWWIGTAILRAMLPDAATGQLSALFSQLEGLFSPTGVVIALLCMVFGFILYCALAAVGGALASKPEDLSSTNGIFTMALVISYLLALFSGTGMVSDAEWLVYFPFTSILVTPGRAITGSLSPLNGFISVVIVALTAFVVILLAGKVYTLMAFYRGNPPKLSDLPKLLKSKNKRF